MLFFLKNDEVSSLRSQSTNMEHLTKIQYLWILACMNFFEHIKFIKCKNKAEINVTSVSRSCKIMNIFAKDRIFHNKPDQDAAPRSSKSYTVQ